MGSTRDGPGCTETPKFVNNESATPTIADTIAIQIICFLNECLSVSISYRADKNRFPSFSFARIGVLVCPNKRCASLSKNAVSSKGS